MTTDVRVTLEPYTLERCLQFWQRYTADPAMWAEPYIYDEAKVRDYYRQKVSQADRAYFAICYQGETVGEIQLKHIDSTGNHATLSIHLANDRYKNQGWGTQAIRLLLQYAFETLGLKTIYADAVHRNTRSQHVLEKLGFQHSHDDDLLRYYVLHKPTPMKPVRPTYRRESMETIKPTLQALGISASTADKLREKDGVAVYRVTAADQSYILKTYANEADRREIKNYRILKTLGLQTLKILGSTDRALLMEDVAQSKTLRLGERDDMDDSRIAAHLAEWYQELHKRGKAYVAAHGQGMYDETDAITPENMEAVAEQTETADTPVWALLRTHFDAVSQRIQSMERTLTYNDFYYTNMIVSKDQSAAFMFDYNLLGKGYVYADLRNVTSSLGREAGQAFLKAYGGIDANEVLADAVASPLTTLHMACQRPAFPQWAQEELELVKNGALEQAIRSLLKS